MTHRYKSDVWEKGGNNMFLKIGDNLQQFEKNLMVAFSGLWLSSGFGRFEVGVAKSGPRPMRNVCMFGKLLS